MEALRSSFDKFISGSLKDCERNDFLDLFELPAWENELKLLILLVLEQESSVEMDIDNPDLSIKERILLPALKGR